MNTSSFLIVCIVIGSFVTALVGIAGLVYIAGIDKTETQAVVTILSAVLTGLVTAASAVITHYLSGAQQLQRIALTTPVTPAVTSFTDKVTTTTTTIAPVGSTQETTPSA